MEPSDGAKVDWEGRGGPENVGNCARRSAVSGHGFENPIPWSRVTQEFCASHTTCLKELEAEARSHNGQDDWQAYTDHSFHSQWMLDRVKYNKKSIIRSEC